MTISFEDWLNLTIEEPLEPDLPICDPHHHLWDRFDGRYLLDDLLLDFSGGHNIVRTVFVECMAMYRPEGSLNMMPVGETEFVAATREESVSRPDCKTEVGAGIVSYADLTLGEAAAPVLEAHVEAGLGFFKGIRHSLTWDPSPAIGGYRSPPERLMYDSKFREGFGLLQKHDLSFDAWLYHPQIVELADLAQAFPDTRIILNHIGGPLLIGPYAGQNEEVRQTWKQGIDVLAERPNVSVKLGGLGMPSYGFDWSERERPAGSDELAQGMAPYLNYCIEKFGVDRCMFESNFPVDKVSYSYTVMYNAFKRVAENFSSGEKNALFHDTAAKVYRLTID